ncbi:MAG: amylo-alpha-1,6-glucosidase [Candidatus Bathyarchaeia archaeon]
MVVYKLPSMITDSKLSTPVFTYETDENPDWHFARAHRFLLRSEVAELGLSAYSVTIKIGTESGELFLTSPNRDYPYEGFLALTQGEYWKFIDCLAFSILSGSRVLPIQPVRVIATTGLLNYHYAITSSSGQIGSLNVIYWLNRSNACLNLAFQAELPKLSSDFILAVAPLVDIRHMYSGSEPGKHRVKVKAEKREVYVEKDMHALKIYTPNEVTCVKELKKRHDWFYKLDDGFRVMTPQGVKFRGEHRELFIPALFYIGYPKDGEIIFHVAAEDLEDKIIPQTFGETLRMEMENSSTLNRVFPLKNIGDPQIRNSILARIDAFLRFKTRVLLPQKKIKLSVPEAGAWWFRAVWFRDVYLNLLQNMKTLELLDRRLKLVRDSLLLGVEYFDEHTGRIPNSLPTRASENPSYDSVDSTLLFFSLACKYARKTGDTYFALKVLELFGRTLQAWKKSSTDTVNGSPVIHEDGLLACVPWHSWTDSRIAVVKGNCKVEALPARIPRMWQLEELDSSNPEEVYRLFNTPRFCLPEVNALWIHVLELIENLAKFSGLHNSTIIEDVKGILEPAKNGYLKVFWNGRKNFMYNVVSRDLSRRDETEGSPGMVAATILQHLFPQDKLEMVWRTVKDCLLIYRRTVWLDKYVNEVLPFGVMVKNCEDKIYLDDQQYHGAVVWPRDTPFLIQLLSRLQEYDAIRGLLISNLDHQMSEGVIFYNHELFSLPLGVNPSPVEGFKDNPVPVKNPAQFWSQWVDPYLNYAL